MKKNLINFILLVTLLTVGCKKNGLNDPATQLSLNTTPLPAIGSYDPSIYAGDFVVVKDEFGDFPVGETVKLTPVSNSSFSFIKPHATSPQEIVVNVNTGNNTTSITKQKIGNAFLWGLSYSNPKVAATSLENNFVAPNDKTVTLNISYTVDQGGFGSYVLILKKK